jgi:hypothetical protein
MFEKDRSPFPPRLFVLDSQNGGKGARREKLQRNDPQDWGR